MENKNDLTKKRFLFASALVALGVIVLLIIFLVNKDKIYTNLKETDFFGKIFGSTPAVIENHQVKHGENQELPIREDFLQGGNNENSSFPGLKSDGVINGNNGNSSNNYDEATQSESLLTENSVENGTVNNGVFVGEFGVPGTFEEQLKNDNVVAENSSTFSSEANGNVQVSGNETEKNNLIGENDSNTSNQKDIPSFVNNNVITKDVAPKAAVVAKSSLDLCFVTIDGDGSVLRKMVKRAVPRSDSPLTTAINLLLEGPDVRNKEEANCRSLIPEGSRLISARVADGVAYLNFNEEFEFNPFGVEGAIHQLEQIVYTATAFSTVNSVQFLIEGDKQEYLGSEGQWIGTPLSRASFY